MQALADFKTDRVQILAATDIAARNLDIQQLPHVVDTGRSRLWFRGNGHAQEAQAAISALNGKKVDGRSLTVNEARPREERSGGFGGGRRF